MKELHWGIVGCGDVVENKSGPSIGGRSASRITAVMRRDLQKLQGFADQCGAKLRTDNAAEVINSADVNAVYIATPPASHREYVLAAAEARKPVLVEKPMGMSADDSRAMIDACEQAGVPLFVAYYRRFHPHVLKMRELVNDGALGELIHGQVEYAMHHQPGRDWGWRTQPEISGGGLFADVVSHRIDLMASFLGSPTQVQGFRKSVHADAKPEDLATLLVQFDQGAQCTVVGNFAAQKFTDRFVLTGTQGEIRTEHLDGHGFTLERNGKTEAFNFERDRAPHVGLFDHIEDVLLRGAENQCSGEDGLAVDVVLDALRTL